MQNVLHPNGTTETVAPPLTLRLRPVIELTDDQLLELSSINSDLRLERSSRGDLIIMEPAGGWSGRRNAEITRQLGNWTKRDGRGVSFDSSTGFRLPNSAVLAPDAAWVLKSRLDTLTPEERERYLPLAPDFVIELRSPSDSLAVIRAKMSEYIENGTPCGWLIDPFEERVHVYRAGAPPEILDRPARLSEPTLLPGFELDLEEII